MAHDEFDVVTGAFGYTGRYITKRLLSTGRTVRTLTSRSEAESPFETRVRAFPFNFGNPEHLKETLRGTKTLFNTYWVRFPRGRVTFELAVENTKILIQCAKDAGVRRIVHVSIANAADKSPLPYFRGKGLLENAIKQSGLSYAIVRPTLVFGLEDILTNNIGWFLRNLPIFGIPGSGQYRVQPIFVGDLADIMVRTAESEENIVVDAVGPETFTFEEMVRLIAAKIQSRAKIVHVPPWLALLVTRLTGFFVGDVILTTGELAGLMADLLISDRPPMANTRFSEWLAENAGNVGTRYSSELRRHYKN